MRVTAAICKRELIAYFSTPLAYVFIVIFLALTGAVTFYFGGFFDRGQADFPGLLLLQSVAPPFSSKSTAVGCGSGPKSQTGTMEL